MCEFSYLKYVRLDPTHVWVEKVRDHTYAVDHFLKKKEKKSKNYKTRAQDEINSSFIVMHTQTLR